MSDASNRAVFLSYASQDAEAAKRICDTLRAAGVEVWFDQSELVGGDQWDQKIRQQIKDCALLIPIISAATQARTEGYFRLEWRLADQRTHLMAKSRAFLLPVVIDDTRDAGAHVPDSFTEVQWTKAPGGGVSPAFVARVKQLLEREGAAERPRPVARGSGFAEATTDQGGTAPPGGRRPPRIGPWLALGAVVVAGLALAIGRPWQHPPAQEKPAPASPPTAGAPASPGRAEFPHDPDLKRVYQMLYNVNDGIAEDFALMDDIVNPLLKARPSDPEVVTVAAELAQEFITRGFDVSPARRAQAQRLTERAVQLAPDNPEALAALGKYLSYSGNQLGRAEELLRRAIRLQPTEPRFQCFLYDVLVRSNKPAAEIDACGAQLVAAFPDYPMAAYLVASRYKAMNNFAAAEQWADRTLALAPVPYAILLKAQLRLAVHGDIPGMEHWLEQMPERQRTSAALVGTYAVLATVTGKTGAARRVIEATADTWLTNGSYVLPKALLVGELEQLDGNDDIARRQFEAALSEIKARLAADPTDLRPIRAELWAQLWLGHQEEARALLRTNLESRPRPYRWTMNFTWWTSALRGCLLLGERAQALALLQEACADAPGRLLLRNLFRVDPKMAPFRDDPEIVAFLTEPDTNTGAIAPAAKPDDKSVAVLAFANLSDDRANEYFSDGISEELLNVLAKVPRLKVAARTSSFYFKGRNEPIPEIAQKLGVAYVVEGSVRKAGNKVRITAQLIKAADGFHVWSETYDRDLTDIFAVQDEIAKNILGIVKGSLLGEAELPHATTTKTEAYALFLQAQGQLAIRGEVSMLEAERLFVAALAIDPDYVPALVGLARTRFLLPIYVTVVGAKARLIAEQAKQAAQHALELDPRNAEALAAHGSVLAMSEWRWAEGELELLRARELAPNDAWVANLTGDYFTFTGNVPAALAAKRQMQELDPLSAVSHWDLGFAHLLARDYDQAILWGERAMQLAPTLLSPYVVSVLAAGRAGRFDLMRQTLAKARRDCREADGDRLLLEAYGAILEKRPDEAQRILALVTPRVEKGEVAPAFLGYCYLLLGDSDRALTWLQRGYELHDPQLTWSMSIDFADIAANPKTRPLLDQPGLKELYEIRQRNARASKP